MYKLKEKINNFLNHQYTECTLFCLILLCITGFVLESEKSINQSYGQYINWIELSCVCIFSVEYLLRLFTLKSLKQILKPFMIIDLLAILPFYLKFIMADFIFLRVFRLFRVFRVLKIARYTNASDILVNILKKKKEELLMISLYLFLAVILASCLMYMAEGEVQECFSSIPKTMWWAIVTFTTVGYGDTYPVTVIGKIIAAIVATFGIALYSLLTGVLGSAFIEEHENSKALASSTPSSLQDNNQELSVH